VNTNLYTIPSKFAKAVHHDLAVDYHFVSMGDGEDMPFTATVDRLKTATRVLGTPRLVGWAILEYTKLVMFGHHYLVMKPRYKDRLRLLFMDTDSFIYHLLTENVFADMLEMNATQAARFDLSGIGMSREHGKALGAFKYEGEAADGEKRPVIISEYVGLQAKMYALRFEDVDQAALEERAKTDEEWSQLREDLLVTKALWRRPITRREGELIQSCLKSMDDLKKCKGVPKKALEETTFDTYLSVLHNPLTTLDRATFMALRSFDHRIVKIRQEKRRLSSNNDKIYFTEELAARPLGHYRNNASASDTSAASS
jgi:hypothetical protein